MKTKNKLTRERLVEILEYDAESGRFRRREYKSNRYRNNPPDQAGSLDTYGHRQINIDGVLYLAHKLAWLYQYGLWCDFIDHIDNNRDNNAIRNLRSSNSTTNTQNTLRYQNNTSGYKGVSYHKSTGRWTAQIRIARKLTYLGLFDTPEQAYEAYCDRAKQEFGEFFNAG